MRVFAPTENIQKDQLDWGCGLCCDEDSHDGVKWADAKSTLAQKPSIEQGGRCPRDSPTKTNRDGSDTQIGVQDIQDTGTGTSESPESIRRIYTLGRGRCLVRSMPTGFCLSTSQFLQF